MLTKVLLTVLVILMALFFIRHKNRVQLTQQREQQQAQAAERRTAMVIALSLVVLTLLVSAGIYYWHWQDEHRLYSVEVINSNTGARQRYQVYQGDIEARGFRTIDGRLISLSSNERMEVELYVENGGS